MGLFVGQWTTIYGGPGPNEVGLDVDIDLSQAREGGNSALWDQVLVWVVVQNGNTYPLFGNAALPVVARQFSDGFVVALSSGNNATAGNGTIVWVGQPSLNNTNPAQGGPLQPYTDSAGVAVWDGRVATCVLPGNSLYARITAFDTLANTLHVATTGILSDGGLILWSVASDDTPDASHGPAGGIEADSTGIYTMWSPQSNTAVGDMPSLGGRDATVHKWAWNGTGLLWQTLFGAAETEVAGQLHLNGDTAGTGSLSVHPLIPDLVSLTGSSTGYSPGAAMWNGMYAPTSTASLPYFWWWTTQVCFTIATPGYYCASQIAPCAATECRALTAPILQPCVYPQYCPEGEADCPCGRACNVTSICPLGYMGPNCTTEIDGCASQPCANGGTCSHSFESYTCMCADGFSGETCQTEIDGT